MTDAMADIDELIDNVESIWAEPAAKAAAHSVGLSPAISGATARSHGSLAGSNSRLSTASGMASSVGATDAAWIRRERPSTPIVTGVPPRHLHHHGSAHGSAASLHSTPPRTTATSAESAPRRKGAAPDDDLDSILADLATAPPPPALAPHLATITASPAGSLQRTKSATAPRVKCTPTPGVLCDRLRCTACDFKVEYFDGSAWDEGAHLDYLFFRNNTPNRNVLAQRLVQMQGTRVLSQWFQIRRWLIAARGSVVDMTALCCQCSWTSVVTRAPTCSTTSWVCAGHVLRGSVPGAAP
ncbi:hypothetical protein AMAG_15572 [Allomyces macrogynus ATCC 38327]|uniref:Cilia- and flagella-associated protein 418 n=1 Tax=Allomyces macrogynus (strain ATCC 38327) TaxID=578462 RepID=A0A0L0T9T0_ALLM3|nr:hypothetical protein AMAG_15572 [Allomyces macrogynus ATCC 38327]|eukprot:KNE71334.1 hypothetical protein AMAG_15572 [Allomyces macrogynus ATCC 38327]